MKRSIRWFLLGTLLFAAGCSRPDDLGRAQEDGAQIAKSFLPRIDELSRRTEIISRADLPAESRPLLGRVKGLLQEARTKVAGAPNKLAALAKPGKLDEVFKQTDNMQEEVEHALIEATDGVEALESWIAIDESRPKKAKPVTAPAPVGSEPSDQTPPPPPPG
jgi:hypothetical protein